MKRTTEQMLGSAPIGRVMLALALPDFAANIISCLYNIVDRIYIGRIPGVGSAALTGVGVAFPILTLITAFANFAGSGGAPLAGIQLGAGRRDKAEKILSNSFGLLLIFGVSLTVLFELFGGPLLLLFGASEATLPFGADYLSIYLLGTIFVQISVGLTPFIATQGRSGVAMVGVLSGAVLNIILDPIFIFVLGMGVKGAALASVVSQAVSAIWVLCFLCGRSTSLRLRFAKLSAPVVKKIAGLGLAPFIMASTESLITLTLNSTMQRWGGDLYVGSITILQSILQFILIPVRSVSYGTQPLISYNFGAGKYTRVRAVWRRVMTCSMILSVSLSLLAIQFAGPLSQMFTTDDAALIDLCGRGGRIFYLGMTVFGAQIACQASFVGMGQAKASLFAAMLRKVILMTPLVILLPLIFGGNPMAVYWAEPISDAVASAVTLTLYLKIRDQVLPPRDA